MRHVSECLVYVELPFLSAQQTSRWWPLHIYWWIGIDFDKDQVQHKTIACVDSSKIVKQSDGEENRNLHSQKFVRCFSSKSMKCEWNKWTPTGATSFWFSLLIHHHLGREGATGSRVIDTFIDTTIRWWCQHTQAIHQPRALAVGLVGLQQKTMAHVCARLKFHRSMRLGSESLTAQFWGNLHAELLWVSCGVQGLMDRWKCTHQTRHQTWWAATLQNVQFAGLMMSCAVGSIQRARWMKSLENSLKRMDQWKSQKWVVPELHIPQNRVFATRDSTRSTHAKNKIRAGILREHCSLFSTLHNHQRDKTHEIQSIETWPTFHHESHCFALIFLSGNICHCTHLILRQSCASKTVFLMAKSAEENLRPLSNTPCWRQTDLTSAKFSGCLRVELLKCTLQPTSRRLETVTSVEKHRFVWKFPPLVALQRQLWRPKGWSEPKSHDGTSSKSVNSDECESIDSFPPMK